MGKARRREMMTMTGYRRAAPTVLTWRLCDLTMNLYLSNAIAMLVREDMYTATQGNVLTNLHQLIKRCKIIL